MKSVLHKVLYSHLDTIRITFDRPGLSVAVRNRCVIDLPSATCPFIRCYSPYDALAIRQKALRLLELL